MAQMTQPQILTMNGSAIPSGTYTGGIIFALDHTDTEAQIYFSIIEGDIPATPETIYNGTPIAISFTPAEETENVPRTFSVRAVAKRSGFEDSAPVDRTYTIQYPCTSMWNYRWAKIAKAVEDLSTGVDQTVNLTYSFMLPGVNVVSRTDKGEKIVGRTVALRSHMNDAISEAQFKSTIDEAMAQWQALFRATFCRANGYGADLLLNITSVGDELDTAISVILENFYPIPNTSNTGDIRIGMIEQDGPMMGLAYNYLPGIAEGAAGAVGGDMLIDKDELWRMDSDPVENGMSILYVLCHEMGHAFGLGHSAETTGLMYPYVQGSFAATFPTGFANAVWESLGLKQLYTPVKRYSDSGIRPTPPTITPISGKFDFPVSVTMTANDPNCEIYYVKSTSSWCTDYSGQQLYTSAIQINEPCVLIAYTYDSNTGQWSDDTIAAFFSNVAEALVAPTSDPALANTNDFATISLATTTENAEIRYSFDSPASINSDLYIQPLTITQSTELHARTYKIGSTPAEMPVCPITITRTGALEQLGNVIRAQNGIGNSSMCTDAITNNKYLVHRSGTSLYVYTLTGGSWTALGSPITSVEATTSCVSGIVAHDGAVYVLGLETSGQKRVLVWKYNVATTAWDVLGGSVGGMTPWTYAPEPYNNAGYTYVYGVMRLDPATGHLYVAANTVGTKVKLAKYDGTNWTTLGTELSGVVLDLALHSDGPIVLLRSATQIQAHAYSNSGGTWTFNKVYDRTEAPICPRMVVTDNKTIYVVAHATYDTGEVDEYNQPITGTQLMLYRADPVTPVEAKISTLSLYTTPADDGIRNIAVALSGNDLYLAFTDCATNNPGGASLVTVDLTNFPTLGSPNFLGGRGRSIAGKLNTLHLNLGTDICLAGLQTDYDTPSMSSLHTMQYNPAPITQTTQVATPYVTKAAGTYYGYVDVGLGCDTFGATIYYGLNGEPTSIYTGMPLHITTGTTIRAYATMSPNPEWTDSPEMTPVTYTIEVLVAPVITSIEPDVANNGNVTVSWSIAVDPTKILKYRVKVGTDGINYPLVYDVYSATTYTIQNLTGGNKYFAISAWYYSDAESANNPHGQPVLITNLAVQTDPPTILWDSGTYFGHAPLVIMHTDPDADIYYTTDGTDPNVGEPDQLYNYGSEGTQITSSSQDPTPIKAIAHIPGNAPSDVVQRDYLIKAPHVPNLSQVIADLDGNVTVSWTIAETTQIEYYEIVYTNTATSESASVNENNPDATVLMISNIPSGTYSFAMRAHYPRSVVSTLSSPINDIVVVNETVLPQVARPTFSTPTNLQYIGYTDVALSCETAGAAIYYTMSDVEDPADPDDAHSNATLYTMGVPVRITQNTKFKARAYKTGMLPSQITAVAQYNVAIAEVPVMTAVENPDSPNTGNVVVEWQLFSGLPVAKFKLKIGIASQNYTMTYDNIGFGETRRIVAGLSTGTYYFSLTAFYRDPHYMTLIESGNATEVSLYVVNTASGNIPSPQNLTSAITEDGKSIILRWQNPTSSNFAYVVVMKSNTGYPTSPDDQTATKLYQGRDESYTDQNL